MLKERSEERPEESPEQIKLEKTIKEAAQEFLKEYNASLPEVMELEYEGFYRRGFFVTKKRYAVIEEGNIIAKGLELVRRDWAPIAKNAQEDVLMAILNEGNVDKAAEVIKKALKKLHSREVNRDDLVIHTQITKSLDKYKQIAPHVVAAHIMEEHGLKVKRGDILRYVIVKGKGSISSRAVPYDYVDENTEFDINYYVKHQLVPAVSRIMSSFGYSESELEHLDSPDKQQTLDSFF
ncbi:DNA polymerase domain-containing protein [Methanobrevibacter sp. AbM4]|uniref:DNA polymerase domain-containing protein n=1 Tax=Methanobrevibacter sp. AbM4 TaxID=224719 RepID=UPI0003348931|nr:DNA polymerase domain-containing protein [Methanobrevibacter sp. AbM4]AGN17031.1 DNA polymerase family B PolB2 [Methanobrevibacter sp. AbM4]